MLSDLAPCLRLITAQEDVNEMLAKINSRVEHVQEMENEQDGQVDEEFDEADEEERMKLVSLRVLRWRILKFKLDRMMGVNAIMPIDNKFKLVNNLFACFLQALEYHPVAVSGTGAGAMHANAA